MNHFDHERLDVYQAAIELVVLIDQVVKHFPKGRAYLTDQIRRAGSSVPLNIAEGAGEYSSDEKIRFYRRRHQAFDQHFNVRAFPDLTWTSNNVNPILKSMVQEVMLMMHEREGGQA